MFSKGGTYWKYVYTDVDSKRYKIIAVHLSELFSQKHVRFSTVGPTVHVLHTFYSFI